MYLSVKNNEEEIVRSLSPLFSSLPPLLFCSSPSVTLHSRIAPSSLSRLDSDLVVREGFVSEVGVGVFVERSEGEGGGRVGGEDVQEGLLGLRSSVVDDGCSKGGGGEKSGEEGEKHPDEGETGWELRGRRGKETGNLVGRELWSFRRRAMAWERVWKGGDGGLKVYAGGIGWSTS